MTSLRRRMIEDMQVRNLSHNTQSAYVHQISRFARYCGKSPEALGPSQRRGVLGEYPNAVPPPPPFLSTWLGASPNVTPSTTTPPSVSFRRLLAFPTITLTTPYP